MPVSPLLRRTTLCAFFALAAWHCRAAEPLPLAEAQRLAVARSSLLVANDASVVAARRMAQAATQLPDPVLKFGIDNLPVNGADRFSLTRDFMTMRRIGMAQELPSAQKRRYRGLRVASEALKSQAEQQATLAQVRRDTALAWLDRYYALAGRQLVLRLADEAKLQVISAEASYASGKGSQADVFAARGAASLLEDRLGQADRQARNAALALARWIGPEADRVPAGPVPWTTTYLERGVDPEHLRTHPEVAVLAAQVEVAQAEVRLAQANMEADWTVELNYAQRGSAYANMVSVGVTIPLQIDQAGRQDQELRARLALLDAAQARYDDMLRSHESEVRVMLNDWLAGKERVARFAAAIVPLAGQRAEAALTAYRTGKGDLGAVLAARRDELDMRVQALAVEQETARTWAQLSFLSADHANPEMHQDKP